MLALDPPIDIAMATDGEVINETLYQRLSSSEFSSSGIHHYVWPALTLSGRVIRKGEVVTRRLNLKEKPKVKNNYRIPRNYCFDLTAHLFLKNDECAGINHQQLRGIL